MSTGTKFKALYTLLFLLWAAYLIVKGISVSGASPSDAAEATSYLLGGVIVAVLALLGSVSTSRAMRDGGVVNEFDGLIPLVNEEGSAIGFWPTDDLVAVPGHPIADAWWKEAGANAGSWTSGPHPSGNPTCVVVDSVGQAVRLGVIEAR